MNWFPEKAVSFLFAIQLSSKKQKLVLSTKESVQILLRI